MRIHRRARRGALAACVVTLVACTSSATPSTSTSPGSPSPAPVLADEGQVGSTEPRPTPSLPPLHPSVDDYPAGRVVVDPGDGREVLPVGVRVADTPERRSHGLMEVEEVPDGVGMWFVYEADSEGGYWMKGTRTDLDIAWVDDRGRIVAIETMEVCVEDPCDTYRPGAPYRTALEVRSGWFADNDVEVGDRILRDLG